MKTIGSAKGKKPPQGILAPFIQPILGTNGFDAYLRHQSPLTNFIILLSAAALIAIGILLVRKNI